VGTGPAWTAQDRASDQVGERCFHAERQEDKKPKEWPKSLKFFHQVSRRRAS
jgi:hypothetical protein